MTATVPVPLLTNMANVLTDVKHQLEKMDNQVMMASAIADIGHIVRALKTEIALAQSGRMLTA